MPRRMNAASWGGCCAVTIRLNNLVDTALHRREWGRAVEALKNEHNLDANFHGIIASAGGYLDKAGKFIDNILAYL
jgi:hypothetical protein